MSAGKGKIARLPYAVRQELNRRIRDGRQPDEILGWLNGLPEVAEALDGKRFGGRMAARPRVSPQNLSEYRRPNGPYEQWLAGESKVERTGALAELALRLADAAGGTVAGSAVTIAAGRIMQALEEAADEDVPELGKTVAALAASETAALRAKTDRQRAEQQRQAWECRTAERLLDLLDARAAQEVAASADTRDVKIDRLRSMVFGDPQHERPAD